METVGVILPTRIRGLLASKAEAEGMDLASYCSALLADAALGPVAGPSLPIPSSYEPIATFDVRTAFKEFPSGTITLATHFLEGLKGIPGIEVRRNGRGIAISPNFVYIEYLVRRGTPGLMVSFYGRPEQHKAREGFLSAGRSSYSRAKVNTPVEVDEALTVARGAWALKR